MTLQLHCTYCKESFAEDEALDDEFCPYCQHDSLFERESVFTPGSIDSIPWPTAISVRPVQVKGYKS